MKLSIRYAAWLLPLLLTGCFHRHQTGQNVPVAPPLNPASSSLQTAPVDLPASARAIPPAPTPPPAPVAVEASKPPVRRWHRRRRAEQNRKADGDFAANGTPAVSAIGQLSSGDPPVVQTDTGDFILSIEKSLNTIHRSLSPAEQKTADQIREFLKQARQALASGDVDGAHTLAAKAKVLLDELTK